jgi:hypothetical protein
VRVIVQSDEDRVIAEYTGADGGGLQVVRLLHPLLAFWGRFLKHDGMPSSQR